MTEYLFEPQMWLFYLISNKIKGSQEQLHLASDNIKNYSSTNPHFKSIIVLSHISSQSYIDIAVFWIALIGNITAIDVTYLPLIIGLCQ